MKKVYCIHPQENWLHLFICTSSAKFDAKSSSSCKDTNLFSSMSLFAFCIQLMMPEQNTFCHHQKFLFVPHHANLGLLFLTNSNNTTHPAKNSLPTKAPSTMSLKSKSPSTNPSPPIPPLSPLPGGHN